MNNKKMPERKIFGDALDFATMSEDYDSVVNIDINDLVPFHDHPFRLYTGQRLDDMVESISEYGIIIPVIVRRYKTKYEILSGHNRVNAAKLAGLEKVPCIVKDDLSEEEAMIYVIETNLMQRSFTDLCISEKAIVLKDRYTAMKNQGKRSDILRELAALNGEEVPDNEPINSRKDIGEEYGLSSSSVGRLLRINNLINEFKDMLDAGTLPLLVGVELSYVSVDNQRVIYSVISTYGYTIKMPTAAVLKEMDKKGAITSEDVRNLFVKPVKEVSKKVKISNELYLRYFNGKKEKEVNEVVENALKYYFEQIDKRSE